MALRQQLEVLQRNSKRPQFTEGDRLFWTLYSKIADGWQKVLVIARPRTILDWQKNRFKKFWERLCRRKGAGRPRTDRDVQELIRTMSRANPTWGTPRIIGELAKLGITVGKTTVDKYRVRRRGAPSPSWKTFLVNEAKGIAGVDFFTVPTATFRVLYVFVVLMHDRRRVVHFNVTEHPTAQWVAQQIVEAFPWDSAPKYMIRDNDCIYGAAFSARVKGMNIKEIKTAYRSPWQNPYCERIIGSIRRDCLDHVIIFNEAHLRRILDSYFEYYHRCRTHLSLAKDCPEPRAIDPPANGKVIAFPKVGGLHNLYLRKAA
jgi:putative transposase